TPRRAACCARATQLFRRLINEDLLRGPRAGGIRGQRLRRQHRRDVSSWGHDPITVPRWLPATRQLPWRRPARPPPAHHRPPTAAPSPSSRRSGTIGTRHAVTIATFTGHGDRRLVPRPIRTSRFTIRGNGNWVLKYTYDCSGQLGGEGNFIVDEDAMNNDNPSAVAINRLGSGGRNSWHVHGDAGRHYLEILTECPYKIRVVPKY